jgi:hypothetical protein
MILLLFYNDTEVIMSHFSKIFTQSHCQKVCIFSPFSSKTFTAQDKLMMSNTVTYHCITSCESSQCQFLPTFCTDSITPFLLFRIAHTVYKEREMLSNYHIKKQPLLVN